jgi:DNA replication protein DnaC
MQDCIDASLLALDDVGAETDRHHVGTGKLCQILSRRERRFTIVTTNIQPDFWEVKFDRRVSDRFLRNSIVVDLSAVPSYGTLLYE